ncbi:distal tail protein Dit, partial [Lacticaseibacillus suibinensis]|uniref:distal tail protein Dit n=1 Tax=Lacticaseibacillus suibinensis TaxID=2486011 RepID=UPI0017864EF0
MLRYELPVTFNGVLLNDFITPSFSTDTGMLPETSDSALSFAEGIGERFTRRKYGTRTIKIPYAMHNPTEAKRQSLIEALAVTEPKKLTVGRTPDRYYLAIPKNSEFTIGGFRTSGTLEFICYDGVSHSNDITTVTGQSGTDITVTNAGTAPTAPILTATMADDNGVVAWTNDAGGVLQFGANDEIDGVTKERSEQVYHYTFDSEPTDVTLNDGVVAYPLFNGSESMPNQQTGPFDYTRTPGTATPASVRTADMKWSGPSMSGKLPVNSAGKLNGNFQWVNRMKFSTTKNTTGRCEFNLTKGHEVVVSLLLYDNSRSTDMLMFEGTVNGQHLFLDNLPRSYYKNDEYDLVITKLRSQVTFRINRVTLGGGGVETRTVANFDASEIDGWTVWLTG